MEKDTSNMFKNIGGLPLRGGNITLGGSIEEANSDAPPATFMMNSNQSIHEAGCAGSLAGHLNNETN